MPTIAEDTALRALEFSRSVQDPAKKERLKSLLGDYKAQQEAAGQPMFPSRARQEAESYQALRSRFQDRETYGLEPDKLQQLNRLTSFDGTDKLDIFNTEFLSRSTGLSEDAVSKNLDSLMAEFSERTWGKPVESGKEFYDKLGADFDTEDAINEWGQKSALLGLSPIEAYAQIPEEIANSESFKGREWEFRQQYERTARATDARLAPYRQVISSTVADLVEKTHSGLIGDDDTTPERSYEELAERLVDIPKDDRRLVIRSIIEIGEQGGTEEKAFSKRLAENVGRGFQQYFGDQYNYLKTANLGEISENLNLPVPAGEAKDAESYLAAVQKWHGQIQGPSGVTTLWESSPVKEFETPSAEIQAESGALIDRALDAIDLEEELFGIADGSIDPATSDFAPAQGLLDFARSLPYTAVAMSGIAGVVPNSVAMSRQQDRELRASNPELTRRQRQEIEAFSAPAAAFIDTASGTFLKGKLPFVERFLNKSVLTGGSVARRFATRAGAAIATEQVQENLQDFTPAFSQGLISSFGEDMPGVNWEQKIEGLKGEAQWRIFWATVPLAIIGGGNGSISDFSNARELAKSTDALMAQDFSESAATEISTLANEGKWKEAETKMREAFKETGGDQKPIQEASNKAAKAKAIQSLEENTAKAEEVAAKAEQIGILPAVGKTSEGWTLRFQGENTRTFETHQEAHEARLRFADDNLIRLTEDISATMRHVESQLEAGREVSFEFVDKKESQLDRVRAGTLDRDAALDREAQGQRLTGKDENRQESTQKEDSQTIDEEYEEAFTQLELRALSEDDKLAASTILGENSTEFANGVQRTVVKLNRGATFATVLEEKVEGDIELRLKDGGRDDLIRMMRGYEQLSDDGVFIEGRSDSDLTDGDIREAYANLAVSYFVGRSRKGESGEKFQSIRSGAFATKLRDIVRKSPIGALADGYALFFKAVLKRASKLNKLRRDGALEPELEKFLARSVGFSEQHEYNQSVKEGAIELVTSIDPDMGFEGEPDTPSDFVPEEGGAPFSVIANAEEEIVEMLSPFQRNPDTRRKIVLEVTRRMSEQGRKLQPILNANRTNKEIETERKEREAELINDKLDTLSPSQIAALDTQASLDDFSTRPILSEIVSYKTYKTKNGKTITKPTGFLMSKTEAKRRGFKNLSEWDDMPDNLPPYVWGGTITPDQAADQFGFGSVAEFWNALNSEIASYQALNQDAKDTQATIRELEKEAREESIEWAKQAKRERDTIGSDRATLIGYMRTLDAMISALPTEVRGKIGGFVKLAQFKTPESMMRELERRVEKMDRELEKWLIKDERARIDSLFKKAEVKKTSKGVPKAKLTADVTDEVNAIKVVSELTKAEYDEQVTALSEEIAANSDPAIESALVDKLIRLVGFGHIDGMKGEQLDDFANNLESLIEKGRSIRRILDEEHKAEVARVVEIVNHDTTGGKGPMTSSEAKARAKRDKATSALTGIHRRNISFEWLMNALARENTEVGTLQSETHKELSTLVHVATHLEKRANQKAEREFREFLSSVFGKKGVRLSKKIAELSEETERTKVFRYDFGLKGRTEKREVRAQNVESVLNGTATAESLGFDAREWAAITAAYSEMESKAVASGRALKDNRIVRYEVKNKGVKEELTLSQDQAINLTMLFRQEALKESMIHEGYSESTMEQMEKFLTDESKEIRDWLTDFYDRNYHDLNKVFKSENAVSLPKTEFYSPATRKAQGTEKDMQINSQGGSAMTTTPSFLISRVTNFARMDQNAGAINIYAQHAAQSNHYIAWAKPMKKLRGVFGNSEVKKNIEEYRGSDLLSLINERLEWLADGGNRKAGFIRFLDSLRTTFTMSALAYNWAVMIKQLTSLPAYAFDMPVADFAKYSAKFMADIPGNVREMLDTEYVRARWAEGYERDVIEGLRGDGGWIKTGLQTGMLSGKGGDIIPVIAGGWMAKQRAYDLAIKEGIPEPEARAQSIIVFEMATDRAQQAGDLKDLSHFQGGGSIAKLFTMFKTSPRQYYANVYESLLDAKAGKKGATKEFARRLLIGQVILPITFQFVSDLIRSPFNDDDEDDFALSDYVRAALLGPLNGLFIFGDFAELVASGLSDSKIWFEELPIFSGPTKVAQGLAEFWDGDFMGGVDDVLRGMGKMSSPFTYYEIIRREIDRMNLLDD